MASIVNDPNGRKRIQFFNAAGERKTIRLGKITKQQAATVKLRIELLLSARVSGTAIDNDTSLWLASIGDDLHTKLAEQDLVAQRVKAEITTLGEFLNNYIDGRTDIKPSTRDHLKRARDSLLSYFGPDKPLRSITPGDADEFRRQLGGADNTIRRICGRAKQFFRAAARKRLIAESPFADMRATSVKSNRSRDYFVTRKEAEAVLSTCPDNQWRLLFALCRFGGLRCPSEPLVIRWGDVDWEHNRITIDSPKTGPRVIPIFPELVPYLEIAWDEAPEGTEFLITRYRDPNANLRTQLNRIIKRAKLTPWPKLFQNLRSTRETELLNEGWKIHQVCAWIGNSEPVAMEHYLQVTADDFARASGKPEDGQSAKEESPPDEGKLRCQKAAQNPAQQATQDVAKEWQGSEQERENPGNFDDHRDYLVLSAPPVGLEPTT